MQSIFFDFTPSAGTLALLATAVALRGWQRRKTLCRFMIVCVTFVFWGATLVVVQGYRRRQ